MEAPAAHPQALIHSDFSHFNVTSSRFPFTCFCCKEIGSGILICFPFFSSSKARREHGDVAAYQRETDGKSALMTAARAGHVAVVKLLLENGAPWNAVDHQGLSAGDHVMKELEQQEGNPNRRDDLSAVFEMLVDFGKLVANQGLGGDYCWG